MRASCPSFLPAPPARRQWDTHHAEATSVIEVFRPHSGWCSGWSRCLTSRHPSQGTVSSLPAGSEAAASSGDPLPQGPLPDTVSTRPLFSSLVLYPGFLTNRPTEVFTKSSLHERLGHADLAPVLPLEAPPQPAPSCWGHRARPWPGNGRAPRKGVGQWAKRARHHAWARSSFPTALPGTRPREQGRLTQAASGGFR